MADGEIQYAYIVFRENKHGTFNKSTNARITYVYDSQENEDCINPNDDTDYNSNRNYYYKKCECLEVCFDGRKCEDYTWKTAQIQYLGSTLCILYFVHNYN